MLLPKHKKTITVTNIFLQSAQQRQYHIRVLEASE